MANIIVATEEQIQEAVFNAVSKFFSGNQQVAPSSDLPDTLSMPNALKVLEDNGFPTSNIKYIDNQLVTVIKIQMICKCKYKTI